MDIKELKNKEKNFKEKAYERQLYSVMNDTKWGELMNRNRRYGNN